MAAVCLAASCVVWSAVAAHAQTSAADGYDRLIAEAVQEFNLANWAEAHVAFKKAHDLRPGPRPLKGMGMALFEQKRYAEATRALQQALAITGSAHPLTESQRLEAETLLARSERNTAKITLAVTPADAQMVIDGQQVHGTTLVLDGGSYELSVSASGYRNQTVTVRVQPGDKPTLTLSLEPDASVAASSVSADPQDTSGSGGDGLPIVGWTLLGTGGAAVVSGLVLASVSHSDFQAIERRCNLGECTEADLGDLESVESQQTLGNVLTIAGLGLAAGAAVMLLVSGDEPADAAVHGEVAVRLGCGPQQCLVQLGGWL